jgi:hypothetical protein
VTGFFGVAWDPTTGVQGADELTVRAMLCSEPIHPKQLVDGAATRRSLGHEYETGGDRTATTIANGRATRRHAVGAL